MRILKTTQTYFPYLSKGGPPAKVKGIARALARRGHEVTVLTAYLGETDAGEDLSDWKKQKGAWGWESQQDSVEAIYLPTMANYRATTMNPRVLKFCARRLGEFDVAHIYGLYDTIGSVAAWCCRRRGLPYVIEPLGMFGPKVRSQQKKKIYRRLVGNALFEGAAMVIATSETERAELIAGGIAKEKIMSRRNGLDLTEFDTLPARGAFRARLGLSEQQPLIFFLGRLSFIKGLDLLVQAFAEISGEATLVIAGPDDDDGCVQKVRGLIEGLQLQDRVIILGPLYGSARAEAFADADLFVLPSRYESFGNAAAESIACGTPVLVSDQCGLAPLVGDAGLVAPCTVEGLRDGISRFLSDAPLVLRARAGCATVAQGLTWDEPVQAMELIYSSLMGSDDPAHEGTVLQSESLS
jgi:glycosyltransferase involved in cell wall biosynthesis